MVPGHGLAWKAHEDKAGGAEPCWEVGGGSWSEPIPVKERHLVRHSENITGGCSDQIIVTQGSRFQSLNFRT